MRLERSGNEPLMERMLVVITFCADGVQPFDQTEVRGLDSESDC
jgi:hypothetical protein